jgi:N-acyl-phosphatidylethanolamine-hydrolysing phospholipase D
MQAILFPLTDLQPCTCCRRCPRSRVFPLVPPDASALSCPPAGAIQALWVGHATVLVQMEGLTFITDPLFSQRCSPVQFMGPQR